MENLAARAVSGECAGQRTRLLYLLTQLLDVLPSLKKVVHHFNDGMTR